MTSRPIPNCPEVQLQANRWSSPEIPSLLSLLPRVLLLPRLLPFTLNSGLSSCGSLTHWPCFPPDCTDLCGPLQLDIPSTFCGLMLCVHTFSCRSLTPNGTTRWQEAGRRGGSLMGSELAPSSITHHFYSTRLVLQNVLWKVIWNEFSGWVTGGWRSLVI